VFDNRIAVCSDVKAVFFTAENDRAKFVLAYFFEFFHVAAPVIIKPALDDFSFDIAFKTF